MSSTVPAMSGADIRISVPLKGRTRRVVDALRSPVLLWGGAAWSSVAGALALPNSGSGLGATVITCPFLAITGAECPFCGMTRGFVALGHGDSVAALAYNPAVLLVAAAVLWIAGAAAWQLSRGRLDRLIRPPRLLTRAWFVLFVPVMLFIWWQRMLPLVL